MEREWYKRMFEKIEAKGEMKTFAPTLFYLMLHQAGWVDPAVWKRIREAEEADPQTLKAWFDEALLALDADAARRMIEKILSQKAPPPPAGEQDEPPR